MNLNRFTFGILLFLSLSSVASSQQATQADIQALDRRMQALETKVSNLEIIIKEMEMRLTIKIEELEKRLNISMNILIGVVLAAIALPQVLGYLQGRREREEFHQQIQDLRIEIHGLGERLDYQQRELFEKLNQQQQDIAEIKSRRIVTTS